MKLYASLQAGMLGIASLTAKALKLRDIYGVHSSLAVQALWLAFAEMRK